MSLSRLWAMSRKEAIQLRRDPRSLALAFLLPMALLLFFGYAISFDVKDIKMAVLDQSQTQHSRSLIEAFERSGYFRVVRHIELYDDVDRLLGRGDVRLALVIPPRFSQDLMAGRPAPVQLLLDGADANTATIAKNYADAIVARYSVTVLGGGAALTIPVKAESRVWYNETLESRNMIVPGLVAVIMSIIAAMLTALTIAREWERGTMEQLAATPVHAAPGPQRRRLRLRALGPLPLIWSLPLFLWAVIPTDFVQDYFLAWTVLDNRWQYRL